MHTAAEGCKRYQESVLKFHGSRSNPTSLFTSDVVVGQVRLEASGEQGLYVLSICGWRLPHPRVWHYHHHDHRTV